MASRKKISPEAAPPLEKGGLAGILYPYQRRWLADRARFKIGMFARQTGNELVNSGESGYRVEKLCSLFCGISCITIDLMPFS